MNLLQPILTWLVARGLEGSTWAGIAAAAQVAGQYFPETKGVTEVITGVAATIAILLKGGSGDDKLAKRREEV